MSRSRRKKTLVSKNLKFAVWFTVIVGSLVFISLFLRLVLVLGETKFDGASQFNIEVVKENPQVVSFSPKNSSISILTIKGGSENSVKFLEIPRDAKIKTDLYINKDNLPWQLLKMAFDIKAERSANTVDFIRLFLFANTINRNSVKEREIGLSDKDNLGVILNFFADPSILEEKLSIEVINATDTFGVGNRLANYITNMGGNVILVSTGEVRDQSEIQYKTKSYTVRKLAGILGIKTTRRENNSIADVTIVIGKDNIKNINY